MKRNNMYLLVDHYDSFVYTLKACFEMLDCSVRIVPSDQSVLGVAEKIDDLHGIIFSPGPGRPEDYGHSAILLRAFCSRVPILGICLGHQIIGHAFGAKIIKGYRPMHGKITRINHYDTGILRGLPDRFDVTRYHSLIISADSLPDCLQIDARAGDGSIMAISHKMLPVFGVQFHPEAVLSQYGLDILNNFVKIAQARRRRA